MEIYSFVKREPQCYLRTRWIGEVYISERFNSMNCQYPVSLGELCHQGRQKGFESNEIYHHFQKNQPVSGCQCQE